MRTYTELDGDTATVRAGSAAEHEQLARVLLEAAGEDRKREVRGISTGGKGFRVPVDIARNAGLIPEAAEFDAGGVAEGVQLMPKDDTEPERVLSPEEIAQLSTNAQDFVEAIPVAEEPAAEPEETEQPHEEPKKATARKAPAKKAAAKKPEAPADGGDS